MNIWYHCSNMCTLMEMAFKQDQSEPLRGDFPTALVLNYLINPMTNITILIHLLTD